MKQPGIFSENQLNEQPDELLMGLIRHGNEAAFEILYQRYSLKMLHYFHKMLGSQEAKAQDFLQDLFVKIIEKAHLFNPEKKFSTWLYTLAGNMCKNEYRSMQVRRILTHSDEWEQLCGKDPSPEVLMDQQQFEDSLDKALRALEPIHREVFVLRYQQELSIREISQIVQCAEGTVKSRIFYALKKLSARLCVYHGLIKD